MILERDAVEMRDIDGHKFLVPLEEVRLFEKMINKINDATVMSEEYYDACDLFWEHFQNYSA